jgi:hypothetical protein
MIETILSYLRTAAVASLVQIGVFLAPGLVLAFIMNYESGFVERRALLSIGKGWYLGLFGWLGTIVHELGHAVFCLFFRHKITAIKLFDPDPESGTLGYVEHSYNSASIYQSVGNFFIGIGPILLGTAIIYLLAYFLLGLNPLNLADKLNVQQSDIYSWEAFVQVLRTLWSSSASLLREVFAWSNLSNWHLYAFIYLTFAIGSSIRLSPADVKGALRGFGLILLLILVFNLATVWAEGFTSNLVTGAAGYFRVFYTAVFLILVLNIAVAALLLLPLSLLRSGHSKPR